MATHSVEAGADLQFASPAARRYELGRQPANTKLSSNVCIRPVRTRGGNSKFRALRLDHGNFSWGSEVRPAVVVVGAGAGRLGGVANSRWQ